MDLDNIVKEQILGLKQEYSQHAQEGNAQGHPNSHKEPNGSQNLIQAHFQRHYGANLYEVYKLQSNQFQAEFHILLAYLSNGLNRSDSDYLNKQSKYKSYIWQLQQQCAAQQPGLQKSSAQLQIQDYVPQISLSPQENLYYTKILRNHLRVELSGLKQIQIVSCANLFSASGINNVIVQKIWQSIELTNPHHISYEQFCLLLRMVSAQQHFSFILTKEAAFTYKVTKDYLPKFAGVESELADFNEQAVTSEDAQPENGQTSAVTKLALASQSAQPACQLNYNTEETEFSDYISHKRGHAGPKEQKHEVDEDDFGQFQTICNVGNPSLESKKQMRVQIKSEDDQNDFGDFISPQSNVNPQADVTSLGKVPATTIGKEYQPPQQKADELDDDADFGEFTGTTTIQDRANSKEETKPGQRHEQIASTVNHTPDDITTLSLDFSLSQPTPSSHGPAQVQGPAQHQEEQQTVNLMDLVDFPGQALATTSIPADMPKTEQLTTNQGLPASKLEKIIEAEEEDFGNFQSDQPATRDRPYPSGTEEPDIKVQTEFCPGPDQHFPPQHLPAIIAETDNQTKESLHVSSQTSHLEQVQANLVQVEPVEPKGMEVDVQNSKEEDFCEYIQVGEKESSTCHKPSQSDQQFQGPPGIKPEGSAQQQPLAEVKQLKAYELNWDDIEREFDIRPETDQASSVVQTQQFQVSVPGHDNREISQMPKQIPLEETDRQSKPNLLLLNDINFSMDPNPQPLSEAQKVSDESKIGVKDTLGAVEPIFIQAQIHAPQEQLNDGCLKNIDALKEQQTQNYRAEQLNANLSGADDDGFGEFEQPADQKAAAHPQLTANLEPQQKKMDEEIELDDFGDYQKQKCESGTQPHLSAGKQLVSADVAQATPSNQEHDLDQFEEYQQPIVMPTPPKDSQDQPNQKVTGEQNSGCQPGQQMDPLAQHTSSGSKGAQQAEAINSKTGEQPEISLLEFEQRTLDIRQGLDDDYLSKPQGNTPSHGVAELKVDGVTQNRQTHSQNYGNYWRSALEQDSYLEDTKFYVDLVAELNSMEYYEESNLVGAKLIKLKQVQDLREKYLLMQNQNQSGGLQELSEAIEKTLQQMSDTSDVAYAIWLLTSANGKSIIELICEKLQQITNNEDFGKQIRLVYNQIKDKKDGINKIIKYFCILSLSFSQVGKVKKTINLNIASCMKELINAQEILRKVRRTPEAINQQVAHSDRLKSYALGLAIILKHLQRFCKLADTFNINLENELKVLIPCLAEVNSEIRSLNETFHLSLDEIGLRESSEEISRSMNVKYRRSVLEFLLENSKSVNTIQKMVCNMCYEVFSQDEPYIERCGCRYHPICINFWLNRVQIQLD